MQQFIFTIHDSKAKAYLPPFFLPTEQMAVRTFGDCINSDDHQFGKHPEDYTLQNIGEFDDETGTITTYDSPLSLGNGLNFVVLSTPLSTPQE